MNPEHIYEKEQLCNPDIVLLAAAPLPAQFTAAIVFAVYFTTEVKVAGDIIASVSKLQTGSPNTFITITGDFNHVTLDRHLLALQHLYHLSLTPEDSKVLRDILSCPNPQETICIWP